MKKIICLMLIVLLILPVLVGCGNENWGIGNYNYTHARFSVDEVGVCADVSSWHDNELGCEIHTKDYGSIYCSEGSYILIEDGKDCPFCHGE